MNNKKNFSPWLHQLYEEKINREVKKVDSEIETDILIVGAGIAGISTAYFLLKYTDKKIIIIDSNLAGHGATGHNAGQITSYFERPLTDIAKEFGFKMAAEAQKNVESAWELIRELKEDVKFKTHIYEFMGLAGMTELKQVLTHLADNFIRFEEGMATEKMFISGNYKDLDKIPSFYSKLYKIVSHQQILDVLETNNKDYVAVLAYKKGATNSALICHELINYFIKNYSERFSIFENSPLNILNLEKDFCVSEIVLNKSDTKETKNLNADFLIKSKKVILCTNGFEGFNIINKYGNEINKRFHRDLTGVVNYMSAYIDSEKENPIAASYFPKEKINIKSENLENNSNNLHKDVTGEAYFYMTKRPFKKEDKEGTLISIGGPEKILENISMYNRNDYCELWAEEEIDEFLKNNYKKHIGEKIDYDFCWHGLLGYTKNGIRLIGEEKNNKNLLYNLGCNGIGILPSIYGAKKISRIINGENLEDSIFDPK